MVALGTFAPPFSLVGGYFSLGVLGLIASIFGFYFADFDAIFSFSAAGFLHLFLLGFVLSIIIGALYQLTSVITQKPFFTLKGAYLILFCYALALVAFVGGFFAGNSLLLLFGGGLLFASLCYFGIAYALSFLGLKELNFACLALLISSIYLIIGIFLGFALVLSLNGVLALSFDFDTVIKLHIYFVLGFMFFVIVGAASVLLPMFSLAHGLKLYFSKIAMGLYFGAFVGFFIDENIVLLFVILAIFCFVAEMALIFFKRVRKALDYWNINIIIAAISVMACLVCLFFDYTNRALFLFCFGFLSCFIIAHLYKIVPFLVWYHFVSPFVGKAKVPLLDEMINKPLAYLQIAFSTVSLILAGFNSFLFSAFLQLIAASFLAINILFIARYVKFKG
ncbi:peptidase M50 [Campylobacter sp. 19-13652]|uniref:peptidase M50 n=1 Tax=Campylobacter sp. 19-13652 TaxID=2840180 RepID=UPI001C77092A|nr:peptidase M50 [Campylobacter sp. 19-13652]BCX79544.1 hypothetical protein LBC_10060 [Campylobacter sp. 19-13652]